jgi:PAS domain S-box-containing protein
MDATERRDIDHTLRPRREVIAARWYRALAPTALSPLPPADVQRHLLALTDRAIALLVVDAFAPGEAAAIGATLARLRYLQPASLGGTQTTLAEELVAGLSPAQAAVVQPRLAALLGAVAAGYLRQARETILAEQETIRAALLRQREQLTSALRASEARFRAIFSGAAIGIVLVDVDGRPVESNPAIEQMLGYTREELRGMVFTEVTHPDDVAADWALFAELVAGQRDSYRMEKRYLHKDGHIVWGNLTVSLVRDERGTPQFTIGMVEDITARKGMEANLGEAKRRLTESRETERLRLARELHDTAVQHLLDINLHLAETRKRAGERHAAEVPIATIAAVQQKVQEITTQLRDLVRELRPPGLEEFGLIAALEGYVADLRRARPEMPTVVLAMHGADTALPLAASLPLFRAAQEAVRNVLEHAHARHVTLSLWVHAEDVMLSVRDDGMGFAVPASLGALARAGHFGLVGIAERVALAGGAMDVAAQPGEGTVITVRIPLAAQGGGDGDDSGPDRG